MIETRVNAQITLRANVGVVVERRVCPQTAGKKARGGTRNKTTPRDVYKIAHLLFFLVVSSFAAAESAMRMAESNTCFRFCCVSAEHSM